MYIYISVVFYDIMYTNDFVTASYIIYIYTFVVLYGIV